MSQQTQMPLPVGILNDKAIESEIDAGRLIIGADKSNIQACSYDMRIGTIFRRGVPIKTPPANEADSQAQPGEVISLFTLEELNLPHDISATAFAINEMSSQGLLVLNPGHVDPGFRGPLTVRAINIRKNTKAITLGTKIFTVIFEHLPSPAAVPYSKHVPRVGREHSFAEMDLEQNPGSLTNLIFESKDHPFITAAQVDEKLRNFITEQKVNRQLISVTDVEEKTKDHVTADKVNELIRSHKLNQITLVSTIVAAVAGIIAILVALAALSPKESSRSQNSNQGNSVTQTPSPVETLRGTETPGAAPGSSVAQPSANSR